MIYNYENDITYKYITTKTIDDTKYAEYSINYLGFHTTIDVELVDVDKKFMVTIFLDYTGKSIKEGEELSWDDVTAQIVYSDGSVEDIDHSMLRANLFYDYGIEGTKEYEYHIICDSFFSDDDGNELTIYIPCE